MWFKYILSHPAQRIRTTFNILPMNNRFKSGKPPLFPFFCLKIQLLLLLLGLALRLSAQEVPEKKGLIRFREWQYALGVTLGTKGAGADMAFRVRPHWHLRAGLNYLQGSFGQQQFDLGGFGLSDNTWLFTGKIRQHSAELMVDYAVIHEQVRLVAGLAIHPGNRITGNFVLRDSVQFNEVRIAPEEMGQIDASIDYPRFFSPYLGIGLGRMVPWRRLSVGLDAGAYFRGKPSVELQASGLLQTNENNRTTLQNNLQDKRIWPAVNLRLGLRFL
ncbi:hypothetical protein Halhy_6008 [Haliscomenobacter hydrossis DSM 1100]|uniref:Uncharacterized protein n=2 Tax=Haliscomenobacter TaxID=2349 RepID=F4L1D4_HALH1|nr:hypothetical protein Halhy_6008 [Haliscomenobacter hydrossis DSM 1100]